MAPAACVSVHKFAVVVVAGAIVVVATVVVVGAGEAHSEMRVVCEMPGIRDEARGVLHCLSWEHTVAEPEIDNFKIEVIVLPEQVELRLVGEIYLIDHIERNPILLAHHGLAREIVP